MTDINFPSSFVPFVGLVFPAIAMASLFLHVQKTRLFSLEGQIPFFHDLDLIES